ncbi:MAG: shikimate kinase [Ruminococcaceae bacterium]|nr:shikimate kinase [Oscillospiraceae bacterium]
MKNIVLVGMPAVGKSTIGVLLAKSLLLSFTDTDLLIQEKYKKSLCDIIKDNGTKAFLDIEENIILEAEFKNSVIATGGSAVFGEKAMKKLKENGVVIYLSLPMEEIKKRIGDIKSRGVVLTNGTTVDDIFAERKPLYEKYADVKIDCDNLTAEECVEKIIADLQSL